MSDLMRCRVCRRLYKFCGMLVGDQSLCPRCRAAAEKAVEREQHEDTAEQRQRRRDFFGVD